MRKINWIMWLLLGVIVLRWVIVTQKTEIKEVINQEQTKHIQQIVHDYIIDHPETLVEAGKKLHEREKEKEEVTKEGTAKEKATTEEASEETVQDKIAKRSRDIFSINAPGRGVTGNAKGKIIVAEFTQLQCSHCRAIVPIVDKVLKGDPRVQFVTIYWPFFGRDAVYASKAALAAQKQNKFEEVNQVLSTSYEFLTQEKTDLMLANVVGLDIEKLRTDMQAEELQTGLDANAKLAEELGISGTPAFVFANRDMTKFSFIAGVSTKLEDEFRNALDEVDPQPNQQTL